MDVVSLALSKNYTDKEITKAATSLSFKQKIVESLPSSGEIHTIYFVKNNSSWKDNYYDEYLWIPDTNSFEKIGSTEIDSNLLLPSYSEDDSGKSLRVVDGKAKWEGALIGTTGELTPAQVYQAVSAGIPVKVQYTDSTYGLLSFTAFNIADSLDVIVSQSITYYNGVYILVELIGGRSENVWDLYSTALAQKADIPSALPNPNALKFTGAVTGTYNGSAPLSVNIPSAVTDDHINELINTKLGVIENGSY